MIALRRCPAGPWYGLLACLTACLAAGPVACASPRAGAPVAESPRVDVPAKVDDDVLRARVAVADFLRAMNARDMTELEARYAIRARTKALTELAHMLDRATGPSDLHIHLLDDPTVSGDGSHPTITFVTEFRWRSAAGLSRAQRVPMRATALREGGLFLIATVLPLGDFNW
jgi:hypothetical protein